MAPKQTFNLEQLNERVKGHLPGLLGIEFTSLLEGELESKLSIQKHHLAPNGYLHAATLVALADTTCGFGAISHLPNGAKSFTTIELKSNFLGTQIKGEITCKATLNHAGRSTQVWDAVVLDENGKQITLFRCTQLIIY